jgi:hypothetical protein
MCFSFTEIQTCLAYEAVQTVTWSLVFQKSLLTPSSRCCWCPTLRVEVASFSEATTFNRQDAVVSEDLTFFNVRERSSYFSVRLLLFTLRFNQPTNHSLTYAHAHHIFSISLLFYACISVCRLHATQACRRSCRTDTGNCWWIKLLLQETWMFCTTMSISLMCYLK